MYNKWTTPTLSYISPTSQNTPSSLYHCRHMDRNHVKMKAGPLSSSISDPHIRAWDVKGISGQQDTYLDQKNLHIGNNRKTCHKDVTVSCSGRQRVGMEIIKYFCLLVWFNGPPNVCLILFDEEMKPFPDMRIPKSRRCMVKEVSRTMVRPFQTAAVDVDSNPRHRRPRCRGL